MPEEIVLSECERVEIWREHELLEAGYEPLVAHRLAITSGVDLHVAVDLLGHGCTPECAERILT